MTGAGDRLPAMPEDAPQDKSITVSRFVDAPPERVFMLLADPDRHPDLDASGTVRASQTHLALTEVGDVFVMDMHGQDYGDYTVHNEVVVYDEDREISWAPMSTDGTPGGQTWTYHLEPDGDGTMVTHIYDWSRVTLERLLPYVPVTDAAGLAASLDLLADALA